MRSSLENCSKVTIYCEQKDKSQDPVMINLFETGQDLYVHIGKIAFPDLDWTTKAVKKAKRPIFKQVD